MVHGRMVLARSCCCDLIPDPFPCPLNRTFFQEPNNPNNPAGGPPYAAKIWAPTDTPGWQFNNLILPDLGNNLFFDELFWFAPNWPDPAIRYTFWQTVGAPAQERLYYRDDADPVSGQIDHQFHLTTLDGIHAIELQALAYAGWGQSLYQGDSHRFGLTLITQPITRDLSIFTINGYDDFPDPVPTRFFIGTPPFGQQIATWPDENFVIRLRVNLNQAGIIENVKVFADSTEIYFSDGLAGEEFPQCNIIWVYNADFYVEPDFPFTRHPIPFEQRGWVDYVRLNFYLEAPPDPP